MPINEYQRSSNHIYLHLHAVNVVKDIVMTKYFVNKSNI